MNRRSFIKASLSGTAIIGMSMFERTVLSGIFPESKKTNILFCIADDASYPHTSAYGCNWINTPGFDRVARDGILFSNAYTPNAKCAPSRACILTGRNPWQLEEAANHAPFFPTKYKTFIEVLGENGYCTGYTGKGWAPGDPGKKDDGTVRQLCGSAYNKKQLTPPTKGISSCDYVANFKDFLSSREKGQPFCFWYGGHEPHRPYEFGSSIAKGKKIIANVKTFDFWPKNEIVKTDVLDYAYELEYFDLHLRKMLSLLEDIGELDNTIVLVTADNGMPFPRVKGQSYEYSNHMFLAVMWANGIKNHGRIEKKKVSFIDFTPTFLDLAGITQSGSLMQPIEGHSLVYLLTSKKNKDNEIHDFVLIGRERHDVGRPHDWGYPTRGIIQDGFIYLYNLKPDRWPAGNPETGYPDCDGSPTKTECLLTLNSNEDIYWKLSFDKKSKEELYCIEEDPQCLKNLSEESKYFKIKNTLKKKLINELTKQKDPRILGNSDIFDEYEYSVPKFRNLYERTVKGENVKVPWINESDIQNFSQ